MIHSQALHCNVIFKHVYWTLFTQISLIPYELLSSDGGTPWRCVGSVLGGPGFVYVSVKRGQLR